MPQDNIFAPEVATKYPENMQTNRGLQRHFHVAYWLLRSEEIRATAASRYLPAKPLAVGLFGCAGLKRRSASSQDEATEAPATMISEMASYASDQAWFSSSFQASPAISARLFNSVAPTAG